MFDKVTVNAAASTSAARHHSTGCLRSRDGTAHNSTAIAALNPKMADAFMKWSDAWPPGSSYRLDHQTCTVITTNTIAAGGHQFLTTLINDDASPTMFSQRRLTSCVLSAAGSDAHAYRRRTARLG